MCTVTHAAAFGRIDSSESTSNAPAVVAIKPQPGAESTNILIAYEDGSMSLWDLHARRPAATTRVKLCGIFAESGGGCVQWLGASGRSVVVAHDDGRLVTYGVPTVYPKAPVFDGLVGDGEGEVREDANQNDANQDDDSDARSRKNVSDRVGVAFDLMRVDFTALPRVPSLMPAVRALFPDPVEDAAPAEEAAAE